MAVWEPNPSGWKPVFEVSSFYNDDWKNPAIDSSYGFHNSEKEAYDDKPFTIFADF